MKEMAGKEREWGPIGVLLALVAAYLAPALVDGRVLAPSEGIAYYMPLRVLIAASLRAYELPFWNPYNFGGMPLLAVLQGGVFFPGNWPFLVLPAAWAMNLAVALALSVTVLGTYAYARAIDLSRAAGLLAAVVFTFSGFMAGHIEHVTVLQASGFVPLQLWAIERYRRTLRTRYVLGGCLLLALQFLVGHPQTLVHGLALVVPYALWRGLSLPPGLKLRYGASLVAVSALAIGLCLAQLLPALDLIAISQRTQIAYKTLVVGAIPLSYLPTFWFPFLFGSAPSAWFPTPYWGIGTWMWGYYGYVGLGTLVLAAIAVARLREDALTRFWGLAAVVSLALAMGDATPLFRLWSSLPLLNVMQNPNRHMLEFTLAMAVLAGIGLTSHARDPRARKQLVRLLAVVGAPIGAALVAVLFLGSAFAVRTQPFLPPGIDLAAALSCTQAAFWLPALLWLLCGVLLLGREKITRAWQTGLLLLVIGDLGLFGVHHGWYQFSPRVDQVVPRSDEGRRHDRDGARVVAIGESHFPFLRKDAAYLRALQLPMVSALDGVRTVTGYDAFVIQRHAQLLKVGNFATIADEGWEPRRRSLDVLGLDQIRLDPAVAARLEWRQRLADARWRRLPDEQGLVVAENMRALPRAWRPTRFVVLSEQAVDACMTSNAAFLPREEALLEELPALGNALTGGSASAEAISLNRIRVTTEGTGPGLVLVGECFDAGWRARAGDVDLPVHRADGLILAVEVPAGREEVELYYEPTSWRRGVAGSVLAGMIFTVWVWLAWRRRKREGAGYDRLASETSTL